MLKVVVGGEVLEGRIVQVVDVENLASMLCTLTKAPLPYKNPNENNVIGMCSRTRLFWTLQPTMRIRPPGESGSLEPNNVWFKRWGEKTQKDVHNVATQTGLTGTSKSRL